jgi:putative two-component system response regulator
MEGKKKILVVDDIELNRMILSGMFEGVYDVIEAQDGEEAIGVIDREGKNLSVILLDLIMPKIDGFGVLKHLKATGFSQYVPVVLITGDTEDEKALMGYELGVADLIYKPFNPSIVLRRCENVIDLYSYKNHLEIEVEKQKQLIVVQGQKMKDFNLSMIDALSSTVEFRSLESGEHIKRVRTIISTVLHNLSQSSLKSEEIEAISTASALHDIGKISIPDAILNKPGRLTPEEFDIMKTHTTQGGKLLETFKTFQEKSFWQYCYDIAEFHHERYDGKGYPNGLVGDAAPIWSQAAAVADVYDALTSKRCYKPPFSHSQAYEMILGGQCGAFGDAIMTAFRRSEPEFKAFYESHKDVI